MKMANATASRENFMSFTPFATKSGADVSFLLPHALTQGPPELALVQVGWILAMATHI
jgi:hypothetical protein